MEYTCAQVAKMIDHSLLNPAMSADDLEAGCRLALDYDVASVCILPYYVTRCAEILSGSSVKVGTTVGFPHGGQAREVKLAEAIRALEDGAEEVDMVVNVSAVLSGRWDYVAEEIAGIANAVHEAGMKVKVIFENCYLDNELKTRLCGICGDVPADWVKTSTGYGSGGATLDDVKLMRANSPPCVQIKAAGGIRDLDTLLAFRALGVTRIGASRTRDILDDCATRLGPIG